ncbi:MAG: hypothetical protein WC654_04145 [Patescibacteria group bacterium]
MKRGIIPVGYFVWGVWMFFDGIPQVKSLFASDSAIEEVAVMSDESPLQLPFNVDIPFSQVETHIPCTFLFDNGRSMIVDINESKK